MVDFTRIAETAKRLIKNNGRPITFIRFNQQPADEAKPWLGPSGEEELLELDGVFVPPGSVKLLGEQIQWRDLVTTSEQLVITAQGDNDLKEYTEILDRSQRWGIIGMQVLRPADTTLLAFVGVRR